MIASRTATTNTQQFSFSDYSFGGLICAVLWCVVHLLRNLANRCGKWNEKSVLKRERKSCLILYVTNEVVTASEKKNLPGENWSNGVHAPTLPYNFIYFFQLEFKYFIKYICIINSVIISNNFLLFIFYFTSLWKRIVFRFINTTTRKLSST